MDSSEFARISRAIDISIDRILDKGADDVFKPPIFSQSIENEILQKHPDEFRKEAKRQAIAFLKAADLQKQKVGATRRCLVTKDQNSFRQVSWLDPFDAVKYLSVASLLFEKIEANRVPKNDEIVHSHRMSDDPSQIFDTKFGYDSFRAKSSQSPIQKFLRRSNTLRFCG